MDGAASEPAGLVSVSARIGAHFVSRFRGDLDAIAVLFSRMGRDQGRALADLGYGKLKVLGTPRKQVGLAGFGLEVVEYVALPPR